VASGYHQEDHWALDYSGKWAAGESPAATLGSYLEGSAGAELEFVFRGTGVDLVVLDAAATGDLDVYLDSQRVRRLTPGKAPVNSAPTLRVASRLRDVPHTARIIVRSGTLDLDGIVVYRQSNWLAIASPIAIGCLAGTGLALWLRRRNRS
jgi:hypothetical protein